MNTIGIDVGSLNTKVVVLGEDGILSSIIVPSGEDILESARAAIQQALEKAALSSNGLPCVATGVGNASLGGKTKSISTCLARGVHYLLPNARMAIDMGAESSTVLKINERGRLSDWANHDKCASGTGLFLQQMAVLMEMPIEDMAKLSLRASGRAEISSTCAVFAESEVISHVHRVPPTPRENIVAGIYGSVVSRIISLCKRLGIEREIAVTGGVALNTGLVAILEKELGCQVLIPEAPQVVAALGAAIVARENAAKGIK
jgi:predicted CoA-substrate-specific enzyme activase